MPRRPTLEVVVLVTSLLADAAVLYFAEEPAARLSLGLLLLAPIVWSSARLGVVELVTQSPADKVHKRRFVQLRSQVGQLLDEIRRLNWMAVDAERGFRSREAALKEMDRIEGRLKELIEEIRVTAGQMSAEQEETAAAGGGEAEAE
ncbi:MAG: hypothetical protein GTO46_10755 [Gemmatimonadetes bacterium]|nr:hypothetical protein [Gemmatimonadota bacterium]NIO32083.1 hypothetical protein [Gemmatimonadota bacterium]